MKDFDSSCALRLNLPVEIACGFLKTFSYHLNFHVAKPKDPKIKSIINIVIKTPKELFFPSIVSVTEGYV